MANHPKQHEVEHEQATNMQMIKPAEGGIHSAVGTTLHPRKEAQPGPQAGQNPRT